MNRRKVEIKPNPKRNDNAKRTINNKKTSTKKTDSRKKIVSSINAVKSQVTEFDYTFFLIVFAILCCGLVMLLSASTPAGKSTHNNSYYFFSKQLFFVAIGMIGMFVASRFDYHKYDRWINLAMIICILSLIAVAIPGIGLSLNGSRRWIQLPGFQLQPSEFVKPAVAIFFASLITRGTFRIDRYRQVFFVYCGFLAILFLLMIMEPHLSGAIVIVSIGFFVLVAAGAKIWRIFLAVLALLPIGVYGIYKISPVRWARIAIFMNPFSDTKKTGYQIAQSLYAIGSGGLFGKGLGQSAQKYSYLPEPYNDFIFSVICEELGLFGAICIIVLFACLLVRALKIAIEAPDTYGMLIGVGIFAQIGVQTILNIAVATSSVPNTGVSLPFFSYGGTSIMVLLFEMGILLNISRQTNGMIRKGK